VSVGKDRTKCNTHYYIIFMIIHNYILMYYLCNFLSVIVALLKNCRISNFIFSLRQATVFNISGFHIVVLINVSKKVVYISSNTTR
jgi:hypothetical protein